jgi:hypothetical protein
MPLDLTDRGILRQLARLRWGDTGFCCRACKHPHGRPVPGRPRVLACTREGCRTHTSITAGTVLHGTKLPLMIWFLRGDMYDGYEAMEIPTSGEFAEAFDVARSTAWLLNQKLAATAETFQQGFHQEYALGIGVRLSLRPPKTGLLGLVNRVKEDLARNREARVALTQRVWAAAIGWIRADHEHSHIERQTEFGAPQTDERIATWLRYQLQHRHGKVSLRWLPRWVDAALAIWNRLNDPMAAHRPPVSWLPLALATPPMPLSRLDPWRGARHPAPD